MSQAGPQRILYIEDDVELAALARRRLGRAGFEVDIVADAEKGLEKIDANPYDVLLIDFKLPGQSGLDLIADLASEDRLPPTIMVSGVGDLQTAVEAMRQGVADFLVKEVGSGYLDLLEPAIRRALQMARLRREKESAEIALQKLVQQQTAILQNIPDIAWLKDKDSRFIAVNEPLGKACGVPPERLVGKTDFDFFPDDLARRYREDDAEVMRSGKRKVVEEPLREADGEMRWIESIKTPIRNDRGEVVGTAGIARDITERKRLEEHLFEEKERVQVTLQSIGDAVISTDEEGNIDFLNPVAEHLTGWSHAEARGRPLGEVFQIINEETREPAPDPVARCFSEGRIIGLANHTVLVSRTGDEYAIQDSAAPIRGRDGRLLGVVLVFNDVTEARRLALEVSHQATHDALTGLVNRQEFERRLQRVVDSTLAHGVEHALCYLDLDQFKLVNDTAGHVAGDEMLKQITHVLTRKTRSRDTLARIGGDEFCIILENCPVGKAIEICESMINALRDFDFVWREQRFRVGVSIGIVAVTAGNANVTQVLSQADVACYTAKDQGRNRVYVYGSDDGDVIQRHTEIHRAAALRDAIDKGDFQLFQQPIYPVASSYSDPVDYEILIRMKDPKGKLLLPGSFITAAERFGLMEGVDRWVIESALHWFSKAQHLNPKVGIALNLSGASLTNSALINYIRSQLDEQMIPGTRVCFEITETAAINNLAKAIKLIGELKKEGCRFALDDFGSGLSSFTYLKNIPLDYLKIEGSLVRDIASDSLDRAMVSAIAQVGRAMRIQTVAEWVETKGVVEVLQDIGVDYMQGFFCSKPQPIGKGWNP